MSVYVQISDPTDEMEKKFSLPICAERTYSTVFHPIAIRCGLDLCRHWGTFNEVDEANLDRFSEQIEILLRELDSTDQIDTPFKRHYAEKFSQMIVEMRMSASKRDGVIFIIG
jgi:hypothetical protein